MPYFIRSVPLPPCHQMTLTKKWEIFHCKNFLDRFKLLKRNKSYSSKYIIYGHILYEKFKIAS